jgi:hypothetical protein
VCCIILGWNRNTLFGSARNYFQIRFQNGGAAGCAVRTENVGQLKTTIKSLAQNSIYATLETTRIHQRAYQNGPIFFEWGLVALKANKPMM